MFIAGPVHLDGSRLETFMRNSYCYRRANSHTSITLEDEPWNLLDTCEKYEKKLAEDRRLKVCSVNTIGRSSTPPIKKLFVAVFTNHVILSYFLVRLFKPVTIDGDKFLLTVVGPRFNERFNKVRTCSLTIGQYMNQLKDAGLYAKTDGSAVTRVDVERSTAVKTPCLLFFRDLDLFVNRTTERSEFTELVKSNNMCVCFNWGKWNAVVHADAKVATYVKVLMNEKHLPPSFPTSTNLFFDTPTVVCNKRHRSPPPRSNARKVARKAVGKKSPGSYNPDKSQKKITDCFDKITVVV